MAPVLRQEDSIEIAALRGKRVLLEPLSARHAPGLREAVKDGELWQIPVTTVPYPDAIDEFIELAEARRAARIELPFATIDLASGTVVGSTRFMNINREHRRVEIGSTFIAKSWQRSPINTEAKYLMLAWAFGEWACNRVEFITDVLNAQSRTAIVRIGAKEEGILRRHMIMRDGRVRDSIIHSITRSEWPSVKIQLERKIAAA